MSKQRFKMNNYLNVFYVIVVFIFSTQLLAEIDENPLQIVSTQIIPENIQPGSTSELIIKVKLNEAYHAYVDKFKLKFEDNDSIVFDKIRVLPVHEFKDVVTGKMREGLEKQGEIKSVLEFPPSFKNLQNKKEIKFSLQYQACSKENCLFPKNLQSSFHFNIASTESFKSQPAMREARPDESTSNQSDNSKNDFKKALDKGILSALFFAFIAGFLTSLTPCIYPMIPITLAVLGTKNQNQPKMKSFLLSLIYVLGIASTYSILGIIAASAGSLFGAALSNIYVVSVIAIIFVIMGLSMYGLFEIQAPAWIRQRLGTKQTQTGFVGSYATGLIAGIVASPCIGPVLVSVLTYIAQSKNLFLGFFLLFSFALGMGVLFIVLGTFSHLFNRIPKAGSWMDLVKFIFGTSMIGMGLYYIQPLYPEWLFRILLGITVILLSSSFGAFEANTHLTPIGRLRKGLMVSALFIGMVFLASGLNHFFNFIPKSVASSSQASDDSPKMKWQPYSEELLQNAKKQNQAIIIDFSAEWCGACKELERYTFVNPEIIQNTNKFTLLRVDATEESEALNQLKKQYQVVGLPTMIFIDKKGQIHNDLTLTGFEEADGFLKRIQALE